MKCVRHRGCHLTVCFDPGWLRANTNSFLCDEGDTAVVLNFIREFFLFGFWIAPTPPGPKLWMHTDIRPDKVVRH